VNQDQQFILQEPPRSSYMVSIFYSYSKSIQYFGSKRLFIIIYLKFTHLSPSSTAIWLSHDIDKKKLREV